MDIKIQGINLTDLTNQGGDLLATIKGIYSNDASFTGFLIASSFVLTKPDPADATKTIDELVLIFQKT